MRALIRFYVMIKSVRWTNRLAAFALGTLAVPLAMAAASGASLVPGSGWTLSAAELLRLHRALAPLHAQYDPAARMLRTPFSSPGYHTTLKGGTVHPTRTSLQYAVALMDTGDAALQERALGILRAVITLQDQDSESKTYGIWPWFLEEPLARMAPPDWNWADFCGAALLQIARDHRARLPEDVRELVDTAIRHAARSIQRRNVGPGYTNIAIMGAYVTLLTAELYGLEDLHQYALARWRRFYEYTMEHGAFSEYNSPTYTVVALEQLGYLRRHVTDPEAQRLTREIHRLAWEEIAHHFHPPSRQWAGPHSRCYRTLLGNGVLALIQRATDGRVAFGVDEVSLMEHRLPLPCPPDLEPYFAALTGPRDVVKTFVKSDPPVVGTTHLEPAYALGSINRGDLWNQRRPLLACWGPASTPGYFRVRLLRDDHDFAAGQFFSTQRGGAVLAGVTFATDGGNTHVSLDRLTNGTVRARNLRLRFELGGAAAETRLQPPPSLRDSVTLRFGELHLQLRVLEAVFGTEVIRWEVTRGEGTVGLDLVLFHGAEREINLTELPQAVLGFAVQMGANEPAVSAGDARRADNTLQLQWNGLSLQLPARPDRARELQRTFRTARPAGSEP